MDHKKVEAGVQGELFKRRRNEMPDAERVKTLQDGLYQKAKQDRQYKFYVLYDKMFIRTCYGKLGKPLNPTGVPQGLMASPSQK
jgi:hypothetical protein